jgi:hypothetical protein
MLDDGVTLGFGFFALACVLVLVAELFGGFISLLKRLLG